MMRSRMLLVVVALLSSSAALLASDLSPKLVAFREIYKELVEINTTDSVGDTVKAAEAMAARLKAGGLPAADVQVFSTAPRKGNLVARLRELPLLAGFLELGAGGRVRFGQVGHQPHADAPAAPHCFYPGHGPGALHQCGG